MAAAAAAADGQVQRWLLQAGSHCLSAGSQVPVDVHVWQTLLRQAARRRLVVTVYTVTQMQTMAKRVVARKYGGVSNSSGYPAPTSLDHPWSFSIGRRKHKKGSTAEDLCMAIAYGDLADAMKMIKSGDCDINAPDASGNRPLHTALHYDQFDIVEALLDICCEVNVPEEVTKLYPIHIAAHKESPDCLDILLEHNKRNKDSKTEIIDPNKVIDLDIRDETSYNTALGLAARAGHSECALRLVAAGCEVDTVNVSGESPLCLALLNGHTDIVRVLLQKGASLELANRGRNQSELLFSCLYKHDDGEVLRLLLEHGQNPNVFSADGRTPLMYALTWDQHTFLNVLLAPDLQDLVDVDVATPDSNETALFTALRTAGRTNKLKYVRLLIQHGANVNHMNNAGVRPIDIGVCNNDLRAVELLLEAGVTICSPVCGTHIKSPLVICAQHGYTNIASLLVFYGAPVSASDYTVGESPLLTALNHRKLDMVELLLELGCNVCAEHWLNDDLNMDLHINTPAILTEQPELFKRLQKLARSPPWLSQLCRTRIRQHLQKNKLPLFTILDLNQPSAFKNFLLCATSKNFVAK